MGRKKKTVKVFEEYLSNSLYSSKEFIKDNLHVFLYLTCNSSVPSFDVAIKLVFCFLCIEKTVSMSLLTWKSKTRVTSYELQVQIHEVLVQIHKLRVHIHELQVQIHELEE